MKTPTPPEVSAARQRARLSQSQAAALVYLSGACRWAEYERGARNMDAARWELFLLKTNQRKLETA